MIQAEGVLKYLELIRCPLSASPSVCEMWNLFKVHPVLETAWLSLSIRALWSSPLQVPSQPGVCREPI
jgi:hypothetical protein